MLLYETKPARIRSRVALPTHVMQGLYAHFESRQLDVQPTLALLCHSLHRLETISFVASMRTNYFIPSFRIYSIDGAIVAKQFDGASEWIWGGNLFGDCPHIPIDQPIKGVRTQHYYSPSEAVLQRMLDKPLPLISYRSLELLRFLSYNNLPKNAAIYRDGDVFYYVVNDKLLNLWSLK